MELIAEREELDYSFDLQQTRIMRALHPAMHFVAALSSPE